MNESLPNITGQISGIITDSPTATDCISYTTTYIGGIYIGEARQKGTIKFDASQSSLVYQNNAKVKPDTCKTNIVIKY